MNADNALTEKVLGAVFEVANTPGGGFLEKVYERALLKELTLRGIRAESQPSLSVHYKGERIGDYYADLLVEGFLVVELKCAERLTNEHLAQCINYLRASNLALCLMINFQRPTVEWRRVANKFLPAGAPS